MNTFKSFMFWLLYLFQTCDKKQHVNILKHTIFITIFKWHINMMRNNDVAKTSLFWRVLMSKRSGFLWKYILELHVPSVISVSKLFHLINHDKPSDCKLNRIHLTHHLSAGFILTIVWYLAYQTHFHHLMIYQLNI